MHNKAQSLGPVVIGGVGGSGTRVLAQILMDMGFYMGGDLNQVFDFLWFTFLFNRPKWFINHAGEDEQLVFRGLDILTKAMAGPFYPLPNELSFIVRAVAGWVCAGYSPRILRTAKRLRKALKSILELICSEEVDFSRYVGWGWKEPNSHIYIDYLDKYFERLKFIHVIRHGLDIAYSSNKLQLFNWGPFFNVDVPHSAKLLPEAALEYWIRANRRAIALGEWLGCDKFLLIDFDKLCSSPRTEIERLITFLELDPRKLDIDSLCSIPKAPGSIGRYKQHDLSVFNQEHIEIVRELGFAVEM
jgi:hypothetical protein